MDTQNQELSRRQTAVVEFLTDTDRHKVLEEWNQTQADYPQDVCIHQQVEAQVEKTPDAIAVVFEDKYLTYQQLNQRANQLAHHLQTLGVGPEKLVGVYLDRSLDMVVALLGILKAGGAYVPLDPAHPTERLSFILEDTQVRVILTQTHFVESLPAHRATVVCLDSDWETIAQHSPKNPTPETIATHLMYVIYTSGSTGQPKGVMIPHAGICNQLYWRQTTFPLTHTDRVLQTIAFSFDPSVWQIFWPLSFGAQLVVPRPGGHQDSAYLVDIIARQRITVIALVPSMLRVLLEEKELDRCTCLRHIFCGGEALPLDLQERFFARLQGDNGLSKVLLHNVYGPTEASIDATYWTCKRGTSHPIAPIGHPIANTQVYILDAALQPVPIGEPGELHIGGAGLARGYLNRPELTTEKFIPNPFRHEPNARLYKTGDLARFLPDGTIEFLGRIDHQVKVRGFRIELGEIEAALNQHPAVQQSVVMAREDVPGDKRLVAYVVFTPELALNPLQAPTSHQLRHFLKETLPEYMIPAAFVSLETLPLNPNGKVDRHALPMPHPERPDLEKTFVAPQDPLALELTHLWQQVLNIQPIGMTDNFFELGGNSLLATRLLVQLEERFHKRLPLATFFQAPTIEQLVSILHQEQWSAPSLVAIQPHGSKPPLFCVHSRNGNVLNYYQLARYLGHDQPFYGLQVRVVQGEQIPHSGIEEMAADYIQELQTVQPVGPYYLSGYSFGGLVAYEMARQLHAQGQTVAVLALFDTYNQPGEWFQPLEFRARLSEYWKTVSQLGWEKRLPYAQAVLQHELHEKLIRIQKKLASRFRSPHTSPPISPLQGLDAIRAVCDRAAKAYVPQAYPGVVTLFRATEAPESWLRSATTDPQLGWGQVAGAIKVEEIPCHHFNLFDEPYVRILAEKLKACLE